MDNLDRILLVLKGNTGRKGAQLGNQNAVGPHIGYHGTSVEHAEKYLKEGIAARPNGFWLAPTEKEVYGYGAYHADEGSKWDEQKKTWIHRDEFAVVGIRHNGYAGNNADDGPSYRGSKEGYITNAVPPDQIASVKVYSYKTRMNKAGDEICYGIKHLRTLK